jgi:ABC-type phosphate transport system substrate-binding protein
MIHSRMNSGKFAFAAVAALLGSAALSVPAFAQTAPMQGTVPSNSIVVHSMDGSSTVVPIDAAMAAKLAADPKAKPLKQNVVVFIASGKAYMVEDHKMKDGNMMVASILKNFMPAQGGG